MTARCYECGATKDHWDVARAASDAPNAAFIKLRAERDAFGMALVEIADPTVSGEERAGIARKALGWTDKEQT